MQIQSILNFLEQIAPPVYQESYDNAGLIVGRSQELIKGVMVCLDSTEAVLDEAIEKGCNLIIAHHPIVFKGLKKITGRNYVERVVEKAIKNNLAIYAIHTNLDNVYNKGVNGKISEKLGLESTQILAPKNTLRKISAVVPERYALAFKQTIKQAVPSFALGKQLSPITVSPLIENGQNLQRVDFVFPFGYQRSLEKQIYAFEAAESITFEVSDVLGADPMTGSGMIGQLSTPMKESDFLQLIKERLKVQCIRHTQLLGRPVSRVAVCGGAGGFLLPQAIRRGADFFITADYKYHEFFDADQHLVIADVGHYESEQYTIELIADILSEKFSTFAVYKTVVNTNPIHYY